MFLKSKILFVERGGEFFQKDRFIVFFLGGDCVKQFCVQVLGGRPARDEISFEKKFFVAAQGMNEPPEKIRRGFQDLFVLSCN